MINKLFYNNNLFFMRIIAGKHKGRVLNEFKAKNYTDLRPTTDRNREALFNILQNSKILKECGFELIDSVVLDGFCGTGEGEDCYRRKRYNCGRVGIDVSSG